MSIFDAREWLAHEQRRYHDLTAEDRVPRPVPRYYDPPPATEPEPEKEYTDIDIGGEQAKVAVYIHRYRVVFSLLYRNREYKATTLEGCLKSAGIPTLT